MSSVTCRNCLVRCVSAAVTVNALSDDISVAQVCATPAEPPTWCRRQRCKTPYNLRIGVHDNVFFISIEFFVLQSATGYWGNQICTKQAMYI
jgi:hypothetical protein